MQSSTAPPRLTIKWLKSLPPDQRERFLATLTEKEKNARLYDWSFWARDEQLLPPGHDWVIWMILAGRGFGKTRVGAEAVRHWVNRGKLNYVNLIGATTEDIRKIMIEGDSGLRSICPADERPQYLANQRKLRWPNGATSLIFSAEEPDRLRGPQHSKIWCDELASWRYPQDTWDNAMFGFRLGRWPQVVITTTPRPIRIIKDLVLRDGQDVIVTRGSTYDNLENLPEAFASTIIGKYKDTRLGRQELNAEIIDDNPGALWRIGEIEATRVNEAPDHLARIVVAVDPAISSTSHANETGIIAVGINESGHLFVLADVSGRMAPNEWAKRAVRLYHELAADRIVAEVNQGGDLVTNTIHTVDQSVPVSIVHATRGKVVRAEPAKGLYEQRRVHHVGQFPQLEDQMCAFASKMEREEDPIWADTDKRVSSSPDRVDALVWAITELALKPKSTGFLDYMAGQVKQMKERMGQGA